MNAPLDIRQCVLQSDRITPFQRKVYLALLSVAKGQTITYKQLAERVGCRSAQAVGQALRRNPFAVGLPMHPDAPADSPLATLRYTPDHCVPCHRVVASDGRLGGFFGQTHSAAVDAKRQLLLQEGAFLTQRHD